MEMASQVADPRHARARRQRRGDLPARTRSSTTTHLDRLFGAVFDTTGQICMNAKRLYVHRSRMDELVDGLSARLDKTVLGYGLDEGTTMGPLHSPVQKAFVEEIIQEAKDSGAKVLRVRRAARRASWPAATSCGRRSWSTPTPSLRVVVAGAVRSGHPGHPVRRRRRGRRGRQRLVGRPLRLGVDGGHRRGEPRRRAARSAGTSGSTTTAPTASTCVRRSAA